MIVLVIEEEEEEVLVIEGALLPGKPVMSLVSGDYYVTSFSLSLSSLCAAGKIFFYII